MSSDNDSDSAKERKEKLELLRAKRISQAPENLATRSGHEGTAGEAVSSESGKKGRLGGRFIKALAKRRQRGEKEGLDSPDTTDKRAGPWAERAAGGNIPRKKRRAAMAKRRRRSQRADAAGVDASSSLQEISEHRRFLEARVNKLRTALGKRSAELDEVMALEEARMAEDNAAGASGKVDNPVKGSK